MKTSYEKALYIHDLLIKRIDYKYKDAACTIPADDTDSHNIIGMVTAAGGVCEAYSKSFQMVMSYKMCIRDSEDTITSYLYTSDSPEPDLIVRTGGEYRLSNFLLWQAAYSELYFTDCLWPDMCPEAVSYTHLPASCYNGGKALYVSLASE